MEEDNKLVEERREKLKALRAQGQAFPNDWRPAQHAADLARRYGALDKAALEKEGAKVCIAGRMMLKRVMGKASFATLQDATGRLQVYVANDIAGEAAHEAFKHWDLGDFVGVEGTLFKTNKGELTVNARTLRLLVKALRPLPEKFHGLTDQEMRYRQRYVDLVVNPEVREVFAARSRIVQSLRETLVAEGYLEVETPMMQPIPGGAVARPFKTHHNALGMDLYLRIAPELYLKRLVVGGMERVFEINRNFRNEGISTRHNPEFTMLEWYCAYRDFEYMVELTETLVRNAALAASGAARVTYQGRSIDFGQPFARLPIPEAIRQQGVTGDLRDRAFLSRKLTELGVEHKPDQGWGSLQLMLFETVAEKHLVAPTFVLDFPAEVSPLGRRKDADPGLTDRFELFVDAKEIANGFSELNDPEDQAERFREQAAKKESGDQEAMYYDADYIRALEVGLPPTAGAGLGVDRLVMLLTDSASIRDVILFPHMRPE
ncbi:MAG TPA: lysine--tRNA ligase [Burkholderiales bacterium]|nr:lysine--tRNA ligase [Burkholderiales bacterium]